MPKPRKKPKINTKKLSAYLGRRIGELRGVNALVKKIIKTLTLSVLPQHSFYLKLNKEKRKQFRQLVITYMEKLWRHMRINEIFLRQLKEKKINKKTYLEKIQQTPHAFAAYTARVDLKNFLKKNKIPQSKIKEFIKTYNKLGREFGKQHSS